MFLQNIYKNGGRAFWVHNTGPFGCLPVNMFYMGTPAPGYLDEHGCVKSQNEMSMEFNRQLKGTVVKLRAELPEAAITYVDVYAAKYGMISNAKTLGKHDYRYLIIVIVLSKVSTFSSCVPGLADPLKVCCGYHEKFDHIWCGNKGTVNKTEVYGGSCPNPAVFVSWDGVHYTEAANKWVADHTLNGSLSDPAIPITQACYRQ